MPEADLCVSKAADSTVDYRQPRYRQPRSDPRGHRATQVAADDADTVVGVGVVVVVDVVVVVVDVVVVVVDVVVVVVVVFVDAVLAAVAVVFAAVVVDDYVAVVVAAKVLYEVVAADKIDVEPNQEVAVVGDGYNMAAMLVKPVPISLAGSLRRSSD